MNTAQPCERDRTARREVEGEGGWKGRTRQEPNAHQERAVVERCNGSAEKSNEDETAIGKTTDEKRRGGSVERFGETERTASESSSSIQLIPSRDFCRNSLVMSHKAWTG